MQDHNVGFATAAGIAAAIITGLGLDPLTVQWAAIGAGGGLILATQIRKWVALMAFPFVVLLAAGLAQSVDRIWLDADKAWLVLLAIAFGFLFHVLVPVVVQHVPSVLGSLLGRMTKTEGPKE